MHALTLFALVLPLAEAAVRRFTNTTIAATTPSTVTSSIAVSKALETEGKMRLLGPDPLLPFDPDSSPFCTWWYDNHGGIECEDMPAFWDITVTEWHRWNPSVAESCDNFVVGRSYCVEAFGHPGEPEPTPTVGTTVSPPLPPTTTAPGNGIETPQPIQPGMVDNCNRFHMVTSGQNCAVITSQYGITIAQFITWNPQIGGSACTGLWLDAYVCIGVIGFEPPEPSPTAPGNGIETPQPIQPGMVDNCDSFHLVESGNTCATIVTQYSISIAQFITWNPEVGGAACTGLWLDAYVCVSVIGHDPPPPTPTQPGNGIETPQPTQPSMVTNCNRFHFVETGQSCASIIAEYRISLSQFTTWNPSAGPSCTGLWASTYACVGIIGFTPSPTDPGNGIETPAPIQDGMTTECRRFHFVESGQTCQVIANQYSITVAQFVRWNPAVGSNCAGRWANTYACVQGP
ncbi:domain-containing [Fusarium albosuccineum]|uniref:Domain-containing n=1 Tax=Fusarium albosuccineum TaxID=1237068 RepID=A0A8H4PB41_9HYPO|nr:domain-containing [Fusarium albosuccineum]